MKLSSYHQKYLDRSPKDIQERIVAKRHELKQLFEAVNYQPNKSPIKIAILGCGVRWFVKAHDEIFSELLKTKVAITTFDITTEHLVGENNIQAHDCSLPLPDGPYDIVYSSVLLKFINEEKQWDVLKNSYAALVEGGLALHLLGDEESNQVDIRMGYKNVDLKQLKKKVLEYGINFKEIAVMSGPKLNFRELGWIFKK